MVGLQIGSVLNMERVIFHIVLSYFVEGLWLQDKFLSSYQTTDLETLAETSMDTLTSSKRDLQLQQS